VNGHDADMVGLVIILAFDITRAGALPLDEGLKRWCVVMLKVQAGVKEFVQRILRVIAEAFLKGAEAAYCISGAWALKEGGEKGVWRECARLIDEGFEIGGDFGFGMVTHRFPQACFAVMSEGEECVFIHANKGRF